MRTSRLLILALALATLIVIAPPRLIGRDPLSLSKKKPITMVVWGMPFEDRLFLDGYARGFEKLEPGIRVDYQRHAGNELNMKYGAWHAAGRGAEVMRVQIVDYHQMVDRGMLEPLDGYIGGSGGLSAERLADFPPQLLDALRVNGKLYALPEDNACLGVYYNKDLFDAHNALHPEDRVEYPDGTWTWKELRAAAAKLTVRDAQGRFQTYGIDMVIWQWPFMSFFAQAGGKLWSEDGLETLIDKTIADGSRPGIVALEFLKALAFDDHSWDPYFGRNEGAGPDGRFAAGQSAMYLDGSWMAPSFELRNPALRFGIAPVPRGRVDAVLSGSCVWGISSRAADKDAGWRMIRWLTSPEQAGRYWDTLRVAPPASLGVIRSEAFRSTRGISKPSGSGFEVPPMPASQFQDHAAWMLHTYEVDLRTAHAPGFVPTGLYQRVLEDEIGRMLQAFVRSPGDAQKQLSTAAKNVRQAIDRDRAAKGLPPVVRAQR